VSRVESRVESIQNRTEQSRAEREKKVKTIHPNPKEFYINGARPILSGSMKIPLGLVQKGMEYCRMNSLSYLDDARMILDKGRSGHAYLSVQLAIEELGKALILKEKMEKASKTPGMWHIEIKRMEWINHQHKTRKAWTLLNPKLKDLHKRIPRLEGINTEASHKTRLECAYVDFYEEPQLWGVGPVIDTPKLEALIANIEKILRD